MNVALGQPTRVRRLHLSCSLLGLGVAMALAACGEAATAVPSAPASPVPSSAAQASAGTSLPASPIEGVIIAVDASSLSNVRGFTLLTSAGQRIAFTLGALEDPTAFPPGHLAEHQATSTPVEVYFRVTDGIPIVYRLADATPASPGAS